jgi:putative oxidoreductase
VRIKSPEVFPEGRVMGRLFPPFVGGLGALGLLVLRVVVGVAFILHGWGKIQDPMHWMDHMGMGDTPGPMQAAAAVGEFGGGIALLLGLLTPLGSLGIIGTMAGALFMVHIPHGDPFVNPKGGPSFELAAVYLAVALVFLCVGPGKYSADACLFDKPPEPK